MYYCYLLYEVFSKKILNCLKETHDADETQETKEEKNSNRFQQVKININDLKNKNKSVEDLFLTFFFNSFTIDGAEKCFNKIDEGKKIPKNSLISKDKVKTLRKGIDCVHDVEISHVKLFF